MIDIGFTKLALISVIALLVVGPERLPRLARMAGALFGRAKRYVEEVKSEVSRTIELEDLRKIQKEIGEVATDIQQAFAQNEPLLESAPNGGGNDGNADGFASPPPELYLHSWSPPTSSHQNAAKAKNFRKQRSARGSAIPSWYKRQNGRRTTVISGAARVATRHPRGRATNFF